MKRCVVCAARYVFDRKSGLCWVCNRLKQSAARDAATDRSNWKHFDDD